MVPSPSITVLISGRGSNLEALHEKACGYRVGAVVSNKSDAPGINWARGADIAAHVVQRGAFTTSREFNARLLETVQRTTPAIVALAGYMALLPPEFVEAFKGRIVNIHPSLLPKYPGLDTHARALAAGETEHGATVHFVDRGVDTGPVIAQVTVPIYTHDDADSLAERTRRAEHQLYPWVVRHLAAGDITLNGDRVRYGDDVRSEATSMGYRLNPMSGFQ